MKVKMIRSADELTLAEPFEVTNLLWGTEVIPKTYGYLGFVPGDGFYLKMVCEEKDPFRTYTENSDPVYRDSAMEAFFMFEPVREKIGGPIYMNFEVNANGALLAAYGAGRTYRSYFSKEEYEMFECKAKIEENQWVWTIKIPLTVLERVYGPIVLEEGSHFTCNFYKISETKEIEHYASYSPVKIAVPDFHRPEFFASAEIVK